MYMLALDTIQPANRQAAFLSSKNGKFLNIQWHYSTLMWLYKDGWKSYCYGSMEKSIKICLAIATLGMRLVIRNGLRGS